MNMPVVAEEPKEDYPNCLPGRVATTPTLESPSSGIDNGGGVAFHQPSFPPSLVSQPSLQIPTKPPLPLLEAGPADESNVPSEAPPIDIPGAELNILSVDGGGIRGGFSARILEEIEKRCSALLGRSVRIRDLFKAITGTSTGSIIALALVRPDNPNDPAIQHKGPIYAKDIVDLYEKYKDAIFQKHDCGKNCWGWCGPRYKSDNLKKILTSYFGDLTLGMAAVNVQVMTYDLAANRHVALSSTLHPNMKMVDAILASAAAPTYFPAHKEGSHMYIDGGLHSNNPAIDAFIFGVGCQRDIPFARFRLASLGTGVKLTSSRANLQFAGKASWAKTALEISLEETSDLAAGHLTTLLSPSQFFRVQITLDSKDAELDDPTAFDTLKSKAESIIINAYKGDPVARSYQDLLECLEDWLRGPKLPLS